MSRRFDPVSTPFHGLTVLELRRLSDTRGYLERMFCTDEMRRYGVTDPIRQITRTLTHKTGTVRGIHFRHPPKDEVKIVTCLKGRVFDVVIDLRQGSPTALQWHGEELSEENHRMLVIPRGFAHAFQTLERDCEILYFHTVDYDPDYEDGIHAKDSKLAITWPEPISELSAKDNVFGPISPDFKGLPT